MIRSNPAFARQKVYERDKGVCAQCSTDTDNLMRPRVPAYWEAKKAYDVAEEAYSVWSKSLDPNGAWNQEEYQKYWGELWRAREAMNRIALESRDGLAKSLIAEGWDPKRVKYGKTLWDADHILPVVEGGGGCGLDNLRTLCVKCHKMVTRDLSRRRATARRNRETPNDDGGNDET